MSDKTAIAVSKVRALMADANSLRSRSEGASLRFASMVEQADVMEAEAYRLCEVYKLGNPRYV